MRARKPLALDASLVQDQQPSEVVARVFIGSIHASFALDTLLGLNITHILNVSRLPSNFPTHFTYLSMDIRDKDDANFLSCIPTSNIFIEAGVDAGGVLVHCFGGRSRSAALIAAFLMSSLRCDYDTVLKTVRAARPVVQVNRGFEAQLRAYHRSGFDVYAAQQLLLRGRVRALFQLREESRRARDRDGEHSPSPPGTDPAPSMRKRSKDLTNDEALGRLLLREDKEEDGGERGREEGRQALRMKKVSVSLPQLRAMVPLIDARAPNCRLTRPGSAAVRVIPPLRGVGREFCCSWCGRMLFNLANVIRLDALAPPIDRSESKEEELDEGKSMGMVNPILDMTGHDRASPCTSPLRFPASSRHADRRHMHRGFDFKEGIAEDDGKEEEEEEEAKGEGKEGREGMRPSRMSGVFTLSGPVDNDDDSWSQASSRSDTSPPSRPSQGKGFLLPLSKGASPMHLDDDSPRIPVPPGAYFSSPRGYSHRPQSAEKSRWLARVSLLQGREGEGGAGVVRLAQEDEEAVRLGWGADKYVHLEYLEWMGGDALQGVRPRGPLACTGCLNVLGSYDWAPSEKLTCGGRIEAPVFRLLKSAVHEAAIALDSTPMSTPRIDEDMDISGTPN